MPAWLTSPPSSFQSQSRSTSLPPLPAQEGFLPPLPCSTHWDRPQPQLTGALSCLLPSRSHMANPHVPWNVQEASSPLGEPFGIQARIPKSTVLHSGLSHSTLPPAHTSTLLGQTSLFCFSLSLRETPSVEHKMASNPSAPPSRMPVPPCPALNIFTLYSKTCLTQLGSHFLVA